MEILYNAGESTQILTFDATIEERHELTALLTEQAVEDGAARSDHYRPDPVIVSFDVHVTNTPISGTRSSSPSGNASVVQFDVPPTNVEDTFATFEFFRDNATELTLVTSQKQYERMYLTRVSNSRSAQNSEATVFSVECQQRLSFNTVTAAPAEPLESRGRAQASRGNQNTNQNTNQRDVSLLAQAFGL